MWVSTGEIENLKFVLKQIGHQIKDGLFFCELVCSAVPALLFEQVHLLLLVLEDSAFEQHFCLTQSPLEERGQ